jgi:chitinase
VTPVARSVSLSWSAGATGITGYNAYVASVSGGPYDKLTSSPITTSSYADSSAQSGHTYYYVVTELDSANLESTYSNEVVAIVP